MYHSTTSLSTNAVELQLVHRSTPSLRNVCLSNSFSAHGFGFLCESQVLVPGVAQVQQRLLIRLHLLQPLLRLEWYIKLFLGVHFSDNLA
jgi:hypothetical protein